MENVKYLYDLVYSTLKNEILEGKYPSNSLLPSEREISLRFQVERTTVRKALEILVKDGLVEKKAGVGTKVVFENDIENNEINAANSNIKGNIIGIFISDDEKNSKKIMQPYYAELFYYLEIEGKNNDCQVIYTTINASTNMAEVLKSQNYLSIIFVSNIDSKYIEMARKMNIPAIILNEHHLGLPTLTYDNVGGAYNVMKHLYSMGHKNIGVITGPESYYTSNEKLTGCLKAVYDFGLILDRSNIAIGNWEYQSGFNCAKEIFEGKKDGEKPTALFVFNDMMAIGAIRAIRELGMSIPDDVSIVGFDNMEQLKYTEPDLTTVDTKISTMAKIAIESAVQGPYDLYNTGLIINVPVNLIFRKTVKDIS